ncbi:NAD(P)-dependent oxidoreductase [Mesobacterium pallidum]|uniref:NAD(P)-dependent oxidoreductase n=1 Tax=Mesobacterium pallidum TaxID=2872037 RepID=UPI001EE1915F|nr:NAD(P)-dependent oxidoreductase [Mesobacterium pallidum]
MITIGFAGLGRMGLPMAQNLLKAGFAVAGYDVSASRVAQLERDGGRRAETLAELAAGSDIVISMIMNDAILHQVALGPEGILSNLASGAVYVDLSTVTPAASEAVAQQAEALNATYLCGAVAGSVGPATDGTLTLFASGPAEGFKACEPAFRAMASTVLHVGAASEAAYLKLVHSLIVGTYSAMIGEALAFGERGGLDLGMLVDVLEAGPLGSRQLSLKAPVLKSRDFDTPPSDIDTAAKDIDMILQTARADAMPLPLLSTARQLMAFAQATGGGKRDIYAILEVSERMGGLGGAR